MMQRCENCGRLRSGLSEAVSYSGDVFAVCPDCRRNYSGKRLDYFFARKEVRT